MPGPDRQFALTVDFVEAATGGRKRLALSPDEWLDVTIPAGIEQGQVLRLKGKGAPGFGGGPPGDALIEVHVAPHPLFRREGDDIHVELPVSLAEAVLGARVPVPTVERPGHDDDPEGLRHRHKAAAARQGHSPPRSRRRRPVRDAEGRDRRQRRPRTGGISRRAGPKTAPGRPAPRHARRRSAAQGDRQGTAA